MLVTHHNVSSRQMSLFYVCFITVGCEMGLEHLTESGFYCGKVLIEILILMVFIVLLREVQWN
jgi:hypothetical protein